MELKIQCDRSDVRGARSIKLHNPLLPSHHSQGDLRLLGKGSLRHIGVLPANKLVGRSKEVRIAIAIAIATFRRV